MMFERRIGKIQKKWWLLLSFLLIVGLMMLMIGNVIADPTPTPALNPTPTPPATLTLKFKYLVPYNYGSVNINPPNKTVTTDSTILCQNNQPVTLTADRYFNSWSGDIGTNSPWANPITIIMDQNKTVIVNFGETLPTRGRMPTVRPTSVITPTPTVYLAYLVSYVIRSDWGNGATISVTITNNSTAAVNGWTLAWTFSGNQTITNLWNGTYTQSGASVSVKNAGFNASIPANGGTVNFGFIQNYSGTNAKPTSFTLNGTACVVQ